MKCNHCGQDIPTGMLFCTSCGARIQPAESAKVAQDKREYRVVFERLSKFYGMAQSFAVKIDGIEVCRLRNGETKEIRLAKGTHQVVIALLGTKSKRFDLNVNGDQHIKCYASLAKGAIVNPLLFTPIMVENANGIRL